MARTSALIALCALPLVMGLESQGVALPDVPHTFHERYPLKRVGGIGLPGGEVTAMAAGQYFVYVATSSEILKINRRTLAIEQAFPLAPHYQDVTAITIDNPDVFVAVSSKDVGHPQLLLKISKGMTMEKVYEFAEDANVPYALEVDDAFIYTGQYTFPGKVLKLRKSDMSLVGSLTLQSGEDDVRQLESDPTDADDLYIYANTNTVPGKIIKIRKADMQVESSLELSAGADRPLAGIELDPTFLYVATNTSPGKLVKINKVTMTEVASLTLNQGEDMISGLESDRQYLFAACYTSPGVIVRVLKSDMSRVQAITLGAGEDKLTGIVSGLHHLFVGTFTSPAQLIELEGFEHPVDCELGAWGDWGSPTAACDGTEQRARPIIELPQFGGKECTGTMVDCQYADECTSGGGKRVVESRSYSAAWCALRNSCTGGMVFNEHATACPRTCADPNPMCEHNPTPRCQCPADKPLEFTKDSSTICTSADWCPQAHMRPCSHVRCQFAGGKEHVSVRHHWLEQHGEKHYCRHLGALAGCQCMCFHNVLQSPSAP
jgi:hypothetical protein